MWPEPPNTQTRPKLTTENETIGGTSCSSTTSDLLSCSVRLPALFRCTAWPPIRTAMADAPLRGCPAALAQARSCSCSECTSPRSCRHAYPPLFLCSRHACARLRVTKHACVSTVCAQSTSSSGSAGQGKKKQVCTPSLLETHLWHETRNPLPCAKSFRIRAIFQKSGLTVLNLLIKRLSSCIGSSLR